VEFGSFFFWGFFPRNFFSFTAALSYTRRPAPIPESSHHHALHGETVLVCIVCVFLISRNQILLLLLDDIPIPVIKSSHFPTVGYSIPSSTRDAFHHLPRFIPTWREGLSCCFMKEVTNAVRKNSSGVDEHVCVTVFYFSSRSSDEINWASLRGYRLLNITSIMVIYLMSRLCRNPQIRYLPSSS